MYFAILRLDVYSSYTWAQLGIDYISLLDMVRRKLRAVIIITIQQHKTIQYKILLKIMVLSLYFSSFSLAMLVDTNRRL